MNRRNFISLSFITTLFMSALGMAGCSFASIEAQIKIYLPIAVTAISNLLNLLGSVGVIPLGTGTAAAALVETINAAVVAALQAIDEYENDPAADKATLIGKIVSILKAISDNVSSFVSALNLTGNPIISTVTAVVSVIVSTLAGFIQSLMPATPAPVTAKAVSRPVTVGGVPVAIAPKRRDRKQFVSDYNTAMSKYPQFEIH